MTYEHNIVVSLEEIAAIIFECNQCRARIVLKPEETDVPPHSCPRGHKWNWNTPADHHEVGPPSVSWIISLRRLRDWAVTRMDGFRILLEFVEPKEK